MSHDEERRLRELESSIAQDDPAFAARLSTPEPPDARTLARCATTIAVLGCSVALLGLLLGSVFAVLGVLVAVVGFALRLTLPAPVQLPRRRDDDDGESGTGRKGALI